MNSNGKGSSRKSLSRRGWGTIAGLGVFIWFGTGFSARGFPVRVQSGRPAPLAGVLTAPPAASGTAVSAARQASDQQPTGSISGGVADSVGSPINGARITLGHNGQSVQQMQAGSNGQFSFANLAPGAYRLTIAAPGFETQSTSVVVHPGETCTVPRIVLMLAPIVTSIEVTPPRAFMAKYQMQQEEKQLVLGFVPNYYVTYHPHAVPLNTKQKFQLAWKTVFNPFTLGLTAAFAGGEQAAGMYSGFGPGAEGYAKRFGAAYATLGVSTFIGDALLPSLLKQDPRFFYKGNGSFASRFLYAITRSVICKGDNGHWEPDYSAILGHFAAGGIDNLYFPAQNRKGLGLTLEGGLIGIGFDAANNLLQEFVIPKLTPALSHRHYRKH